MFSAPVRALRRSRCAAMLTAVLGVLTACGGEDSGGDPGTGVPVPASISLSAPSLTITSINGTGTVTASVRDASGAAVPGATINWTSDAPAVASVSGSGVTGTIRAVGRGAAVISARSGALTTTVSVFVRSASSVSVTPGTVAIRVGNTASLQAAVTADDGASNAVTWTSATPAVATVSAQGLVTAVAPGTVVITARSVSDPRLEATSTVTVAPARSVVITPTTMDIGRDEARPLSAQVFVDPGAPTGVTWRSNRPLIATVTQQGTVTGVSDGEATITAVSVADSTLRATALVRVVPVVRSIVVSPSAATLNIAESRTFTAALVVDQGASSAISWSSSNPAVASVNAQGVTTAIAVGTTTIRARSVADTTRESVATVLVTSRPISVVLSTNTLGLTAGRTATVSATVSADPGVSTEVQWISLNSGVATVTSQGVVTAVGPGATRVVARAVADANATDTVSVTVVPLLANAWGVDRLGGPLIEDIVSMWAASATTAYAVNSNGDVFRWNGTTWANALRGEQFGTSFQAVHGSSSSTVTAVGTNGVIVHYDGTGWREMSSGTTAALSDVWVHSQGSAWAVGAGGVAVRRSGDTWTVSESGTTERLRGVWGTDAMAYAVGDGGTIRRWQNSVWTPLASGTAEILHDVWSPPGAGQPIYVVGDFGTLLRWNGAAFEAEQSGTLSSLLAVTGGGSGSVLVSGDGVVLSREGGTWQDLMPPFSTRFGSAAFDASGALWIGGQRGLVMRASATGAWSTLSLTPDLLDVWSSSATHAIAVGELGFVFAYNGTTWTRQTAPTLERLNTVWAASSVAAFVGGDNGVLLRWDGSSWSEQASPTSDHIYAMWGANTNAVWAVTEGGEVLRYDGSSWQVEHSQSSPLYGVYGTSIADVHAVGLDGTALHWNGTTWTARNTGTSHVLVGLWAADSAQALTVGARDFSSGVALRYDRGWSEVPPGTNRILSAVWGAVGFDLYAVGDLGTVVRFNGTAWQTMTSGTSEFLWAIAGAPDASGAGFAVGLNGAVLQGLGGGQAVPTRLSGGRPRWSLEPARGARAAADRTLPRGGARKRR